MTFTPRISNPEAKTKLIIVMGVSGSGKSSVAKALAEHYGFRFLDADDFHSHENRNRMAQGLPLTDEMRKPWVDSIKAYLQSAAAESQNCTLAFSGLRKLHRDQLRSAGLQTIFIFLKGNKDTIQERVNLRKNHFMAPGLVDSQFAALEAPDNEADVAQIDILADLKSVTANCIQLLDKQFFCPMESSNA